MKNACVLIIAVLLLGGCTGAYMAPGGPNTARLIIQNATGDVLPVETFEDAKDCSGRLALHPRGGVPANSAFTVAIAANAPFTLSAKGSAPLPASAQAPGMMGGVKYCTIAGTFVPEPGRTYVALYRSSAGRCILQLAERTTDQSGKAAFRPERSFKQRDEAGCR